MPKTMLICKNCGKEYEACRTPNPNGNWRWRDVGCSYECALAYLKAVEAARGEPAKELANEPKAAKAKVEQPKVEEPKAEEPKTTEHDNGYKADADEGNETNYRYSRSWKK